MPGEYLDPSQWPLWMQSGGVGPIPGSTPAQQMPGQGLRDSVQPMVDQIMANRQKGIFDRLGEMFGPRRDEQGMPQAPGVGDFINAALLALPGMRGGRAAPVFAAEKGAGSGAGSLGVADHVARLEGALGKEEFMPAMDALRADKAIPHQDLLDIAKGFSGGSVRASASRKQVLDKIQERHDRLVPFLRDMKRGVGSRSAS